MQNDQVGQTVNAGAEADIGMQEYISMLPENMGLEGFTLRDLNVSIMRIIEANSQQRKKNSAQYMPEAEEGDIFDIGLKILYKSFFFLPLKHVKMWVEWIPREKGGGFVANHPAPLQTDSNFMLPNGNELTETSFFLGWILHSDGSKTFAIIPMEKTRLRDAKDFSTLIFNEKDANGNQVPMGVRIFKVTTGSRSKPKGDYHGWEVTRTKGTIVSWAKKFNLNLREVALEATEVNRSGDEYFRLTGAQQQKQLSSGSDSEQEQPDPKEAGDARVVSQEELDEPF